MTALYTTGPASSTTAAADALGLDRPLWHADALCAEYPQVDFFPDPREVEAIAAALTVCARCLVRAECATAAKAGSEVGIWGGRLRLGRGQRLPARANHLTPDHAAMGRAAVG